jgi:hypothetical protein
MIVDRLIFKYQAKSHAKTELLSTIHRIIGAFPTLETALRNNSLNDDQWGQLRHFSYQINKALSTVKALGIKSNLFGEVQDLISRMDTLGNNLLNSRKSSYIVSPSYPTTLNLYIQNLKNIEKESVAVRSDAQNLVDKLLTEFNKKKYLIFSVYNF